jgi:glutamyl-tRNA synthetase/glutamyl-Q tRNA(Asp) synthetase
MLTTLSELGRAAASRLARPPITRFAPSPTGYLHLGHVVNALFVWGIARATGGRVLLRLEDHDRVRCRPEFEAACLDDLAWLGFVPDDGLTPLFRQQDHNRRYARALARLVASDRVYACACSRRDVGGERYDGRCRLRGLRHGSGRGLRVRLDDDTETATDLLRGSLSQRPAGQCGDLLVKDRDGQWTYQLAVTVDDLEQDVTLIVRGEDLIDSTGRQLALARLLGRTSPPLFLHHPLIYASPGVKLSKSAGDSGVRALRRSGASPEAVIGRAAAAVGLVPQGTPVPAREVHRLFGG